MFVLVPFFEVNKTAPPCSCVAMMREQVFYVSASQYLILAAYASICARKGVPYHSGSVLDNLLRKRRIFTYGTLGYHTAA